MAFTPLNALNAFIAVARRRSFAAAARDLGVSPSALSQSVKQLEQRIGTTLMARTSRSVSLTDAGERLLASAGPSLDNALEALQGASVAPDEVSGRLRLSVPSVSVPLVLTRLVPLFVERFPKVQLDVRVENRLVDLVGEGLDAGIRLIERIDRDMVHVRVYGKSRIVVAAAPSYLERRGTPQKPQDLAQHDCIGFRSASSEEPWAWELERGKKTWRVQVHAPVITNDHAFTRALALAGVGLTYGLEAGMTEELGSGRLRIVLPQYAPTIPGLFLYFPNRRQTSPCMRAFVALAREALSDA